MRGEGVRGGGREGGREGGEEGREGVCIYDVCAHVSTDFGKTDSQDKCIHFYPHMLADVQ